MYHSNHPDKALVKTSQSNVLIYRDGLSDPKMFHFDKKKKKGKEKRLSDLVSVLQSSHLIKSPTSCIDW